MSTQALVIFDHSIDVTKELSRRCEFYLKHCKAANTIRAYRSDWSDFELWCRTRNSDSLPASTASVAAYITDLADRGCKASTIQRRLTAISQAHEIGGFESPTKTKLVRTTLSGIRRAIGVAQIGKQALLTTDIRAMSEALANDLTGLRDRALILLGYAGAFRRSELVALDWHDIEFRTEGLIITLRRSKTDQESNGRTVGVPYGSNPLTCPVRSLAAWREAGCCITGPQIH